jgi:serine/threonine protein phosphatase PrpC
MPRADSHRENQDAISDACRHALGEMLPRLLERTHWMEPSAVFGTIRDEAVTVGLDDLQIYLIDKQQASLIDVQDPGDRVPLVGTIIGDAYSHQRPHLGEDEGRTRITVPLVDGEDRLGVLVAITVLERDEAFFIGQTVAASAAEILVNKNTYTDEFERVRRTESMSLAAEMRWALLPPLTFRSPRASIAGILAPFYDIAGDAFDYAVNGDTAHLAIFDAVGHGLEAARVADLAIAAYRHARRKGVDLPNSAVAIDEGIRDQFERAIFVTALLAELDLETGRLQWVNAGHPRPIILRNGKIVAELQTRPMLPLGLHDRPEPIEIGETRLEPRDTVLLFSDGVTEARAPNGDFFGIEGLADHLVRSATTGLVQAEALRRLVGRLTEFQAGNSRDDATLLLVTWRPAES